MAGATQRPMARAGVAFELEALELEDGRLVVSGWWSGVRGLRFVRPTLVAQDRAVLATLEHKPWAPGGDTPWTAAFPWEHGAVDAGELLLAVAPSVTVPLVPGAQEPAPAPEPPEAAPEPPPAAAPPTAQPGPRVADLEAEVTALRGELAAAAEERDALRGRLDAAHAAAGGERRAARDAVDGREDLDRARAAAERDRDRVAAQRDEAVHDREAAVRTRQRMEAQLREALEAHDAARAERAELVAQREDARTQRDELLLAHRALQRSARTAGAPAPAPAAAPAGRPDTGAHPDADDDAPIGVRAMPAVRAVAADLHRSQTAPRGRELSTFDLWAIRFFGSIAAICFISLLVMVLRVFV